MKNIPCQEKAMRAGEKDEQKNWAQGAKEAVCEYCIILVMMEDA